MKIMYEKFANILFITVAFENCIHFTGDLLTYTRITQELRFSSLPCNVAEGGLRGQILRKLRETCRCNVILHA